LTAISRRHPALPYIVPFAAFLVFLGVQDYVPLPPRLEQPLRVFLLTAILWVFSRHVIDLRVRSFLLTMMIGVGVFIVWIAPDVLWPGYRDHWIFQNSITGHIKTSIAAEARTDWVVLTFRTIRAVILVPIIEELFWRMWLMRWLVSDRFEEVKPGAYTPRSFWITAVLFAAEHGPYWEVGLLAGIAYNWLMVRTKSLGDCILAHAVTNGVLCWYVLATGQWQYWM
jgi:CAAX protease family protein